MVEAGLLPGGPGETTLIVLGVAVEAALVSRSDAAFWQAATALGITADATACAWRPARDAASRLAAGCRSRGRAGRGRAGHGYIGLGRVGRMVAEILRAHGRRFIAVDAEVDCVAAGRRDGFPVVYGDVVRPDLVERLHLGRAEALVLTMDDPALSVRLTTRVRALEPGLTIIARARDAGHAAELYRAAVTDAVPETLESSLQLSGAVLVDLGIAMKPVIASIHKKKRDEPRRIIREEAAFDREPRIRRVCGRGEQLG